MHYSLRKTKSKRQTLGTKYQRGIEVVTIVERRIDITKEEQLHIPKNTELGKYTIGRERQRKRVNYTKGVRAREKERECECECVCVCV